MYYNTTHQTGEKLKDYQNKAETQKQRIISYLKTIQEYGVPTSSSRIYSFVFNKKAPIGSIRRAVSDLVNKDEIAEYTGKKVIGLYDREENLVRLKTKTS